MIPFFRKLIWLARRRNREQELNDELQFHLEEEAEQRRAEGLSADQAKWAARRDLGNHSLVREDTRSAWGWTVVEQFWQDVHYAFRAMASQRSFTLMAVLSLALGIGAATAIFSVVNAVLLRPLPYKAASRLVAVSSEYRQAGEMHVYPSVSLTEVESWRSLSSSIKSIGSFILTTFPISVGDRALSVVAVAADQELLSTLGVDLALGRNFSNGGSSHKDLSAIISHKLWVEAFQSDPSAIGRAMTVNGQLYTLIGVLPASFQVPRSDASYFPEAPDLLFPVANIADVWGRDSSQWFAVARLKPGVTIPQAEAQLRALNSGIVKQPGLSVKLSALDKATTAKVRLPLLLVLGVSIVLLVIACTNIMNLLFSRSASRTREMAIRKAAGASNLRLVRQMLTESACLAILGGLLGLGLAWSVVDPLVGISPAHLPVTGRVGIDPMVFGFTSILCVGTAILAGLFPALQASLQRGAVPGSRAIGGHMLARFQQSLTVVQVALGLGLLAVAGLLTHSLFRLSSVDPGFRTEGVIGFELSVPGDHSYKQTKPLLQRMLDETRTIPGVLSAGWITNLPPETRQGMFMPFSIVGASAQASLGSKRCNYQVASEDYFQTVAVPLVRGRDFTRADVAGALPVLIVNEAFTRYFGSTDPLGQSVLTAFDSKTAPRQIIGIIRDTHDRGLSANAVPTAYLPLAQFWQPYGSIALRVNGSPEVIIPEIRSRLTRIDPTVPLKNFTTIGARVHKSLGEPRFYAILAGVCALMAVLFVTLGLYGVISYSVSRRTAEIGVRMALGAPRQSILRDVLWRGLRLAAMGVAIGLAISLAASRVLTSLLFEIKPNDPATLSAVAGLVLIVTLLASYLPARRASRVDPMVALRHE